MKWNLVWLFLSLVACSRSFESLQPKADEAVSRWACSDLQSSLFDVAYAALIDLKIVPTKTDFVQLFDRNLAERPTVDFNREEFKKNIGDFYEIILNQTHDSVPMMLQKIAAAELGSQEDEQAREVQKDLARLKQRWSEVVIANQGQCASLSKKTLIKKESFKNSVTYGALKTFATAYQSCEVISKPAMVFETPGVKGIAIIGTSPDGAGRKRIIADLPALLLSDYYLQDFSLKPQCRDVRKSPLIYDYGGKPDTPTSQNVLDLFTNSGSGTAALGIDCSAYVFTVIASAGLKLDPERKLKPVLVHGINAVLYKEPQQNGMPCLEKIRVGENGTLKAGDIAAKVGHVLILDSVGADPLGIGKATTVDQCNRLTSDGFDFVVVQSSPAKNGIGLNKFVGKDYMLESPAMKSGFEKYAREACKARLKGQDVLISGQEVQLVRHKLTAECIDEPVQLVGEVCVQECAALK